MLRFKMKDKQGGFTLIELMFTIFVMAILLGIGVPSFREFRQASRMAASTNNLLADLNFARSEAIKRRQPVTLCRSSDGATCEAGLDPFSEWIVFLDSTEAAAVVDDPLTVADETAAAIGAGNGVVDDDEPVIRTGAFDAQVAAGVDGSRTVFQPSGFPDRDVGETVTQFIVCDARGNVASAGEESAARAITISPVGRPTLTRAHATIEDLGGCSP
jgi:type IV fimbrial biogenesis protein FimT